MGKGGCFESKGKYAFSGLPSTLKISKVFMQTFIYWSKRARFGNPRCTLFFFCKAMMSHGMHGNPDVIQRAVWPITNITTIRSMHRLVHAQGMLPVTLWRTNHLNLPVISTSWFSDLPFQRKLRGLGRILRYVFDIDDVALENYEQRLSLLILGFYSKIMIFQAHIKVFFAVKWWKGAPIAAYSI